ncbi:hypothetical protein BDR26DRAFT_930976 [Obelidium mucronatum]|nr:hypothetical protein BDR26DRAFT_930976 [Obelidium mucronatum]
MIAEIEQLQQQVNQLTAAIREKDAQIESLIAENKKLKESTERSGKATEHASCGVPNNQPTRASPLVGLPFEVLVNIFLQMNVKDAFKYAATVCRLFLRVLDSDEFWVIHCQQTLESNKPLSLIDGIKSFKLMYFAFLTNLLKAGDLSNEDVWEWRMTDTIEVIGIGEGIAGVRPHPRVQAAFASSFSWGYLTQTAQVSHIPFDAFKVIRGVLLEFWVASRMEMEGQFRCSVQFDESPAVLLNHASPITLGPSTPWTRVQYIVAFPETVVLKGRVDTIRLFWEGKDTVFWAGHYGTKVTNLSMRFVSNIDMAGDSEVVMERVEN